MHSIWTQNTTHQVENVVSNHLTASTNADIKLSDCGKAFEKRMHSNIAHNYAGRVRKMMYSIL